MDDPLERLKKIGRSEASDSDMNQLGNEFGDDDVLGVEPSKMGLTQKSSRMDFDIMGNSSFFFEKYG